MNNLQKEIIKIVESSGSNGIKAKDIAKKINSNITKREVNQYLYGPLYKQLFRDQKYMWYSSRKLAEIKYAPYEYTDDDAKEAYLKICELSNELAIKEENIASMCLVPRQVFIAWSKEIDLEPDKYRHLLKLSAVLNKLLNEGIDEINKEKINSFQEVSSTINVVRDYDLESSEDQDEDEEELVNEDFDSLVTSEKNKSSGIEFKEVVYTVIFFGVLIYLMSG